MDLQRILDRVKILTGDEREALLTTLCTDAVRMLENRLHCTPETEKIYADALCAAAAAEVLYQLVLIDAAQAPDSLTAGMLRADFKNDCARAEAYRKACFRALSPILRDEGFFFGGVKVCE